MADPRDEPSGADQGVVTTQPTTEATPPPVVPERGAPPPPTGVLGLLVREQSIIVPLVAVVAALLIGALLIRAQGVNPTYAYQTLFTYSFLTADGLQGTFEKMVPLILCGLAVVIPLRVGLFNIGAQGQLMAGAIAAAATAHAVREAPGVIIAVVAMVAGILFGAMWGSIAGALKATRGVHEVISTIMLNSIAAGLIDYLVNGPFKDPSSPYPASYSAPDASRFVPLGVVPIGLPIALVLAVLVAWMLRRTTLGFQFETIGRNRHAASYAGIKLSGMIVLAMAIAGGLAGLAGSVEYLEIDPYRYQDGIAGSLGFDGITIALLARSNPLGTIPAALLVGALRAGSSNLSFNTGLQPEIVDMLLAITLLLVSLPIIAKLIFRRHTAKSSALASSWGS
ncbi:MAG: ABC transporter permease [Dermatophilaceae bacterium]|nr:ABC transporter permease [Dermatophilaceae bacterium]NUO89358.1 ABC transporter permease [Dermatophilaceae bacterium]NUR15314.1 ABC transporter permease [Dermatophilaceae bacterium]NUR80496.1 ABC transporter permease [Dermatophilaceae bacterium]